MKRAIWALVIAVPLVVLLAYGFGRNPGAIASPLINKRAPAFTLRTIDGGSLSLRQLRGKPVVLNFWASWCPACKVEHPYLVQAWERYGLDVSFIGVVYQDSAANARGFMRQYGGAWPSVLDPGQRTSINFGVYGVPETFFIDRRGIIRAKVTGGVTPAILNRQIGRLLRPNR